MVAWLRIDVVPQRLTALSQVSHGKRHKVSPRDFRGAGGSFRFAESFCHFAWLTWLTFFNPSNLELKREEKRVKPLDWRSGLSHVRHRQMFITMAHLTHPAQKPSRSWTRPHRVSQVFLRAPSAAVDSADSVHGRQDRRACAIEVFIES